MKKRKMVLAAVLCLAMLLSGCGGNAASSAGSPAEEAVGSPAEEAAGSPAEEAAGSAADTSTGREANPVSAAAEMSGQETEAGSSADESTAGDEAEAATEGKAFSSRQMNFSFLYDPRHKAYITENGAAQLAFEGDTSLCGLFVSVADAENLPDIEEMLEEDMFGETQKYLNAMVEEPRASKLLAAGHRLRGYTFAYSARTGETVDGSYYIEKRDDKYIFYRTEVYRSSADAYAAEAAIEMTAETISFSPDTYGAGEAAEGEIGSDNTPEAEDPPYGAGEDIPDGAFVPDTEGDYTFSMDKDYLVLADGQTTMVYTGGGMQIPFYLIEEATDEVSSDSIEKQVVAEMNDVTGQLKNRIVDQP